MAKASTPQEDANEVQAPKERGVWQFESLEPLQFMVQTTVMAKDKRGKRLGPNNLPAENFFEAEDLADWVANLEEELDDSEFQEKLRAQLMVQREQMMNGAAGGPG